MNWMAILITNGPGQNARVFFSVSISSDALSGLHSLSSFLFLLFSAVIDYIKHLTFGVNYC